MPTSSLDPAAAADFFQKAGEALNKKIQSLGQQLSQDQREKMSAQVAELLQISNTLYAMEVIQIQEEAATAFQSVNEGSNEINEVIKTVNNVQGVINLSAKVISLGISLASGNVQGIISNGKDVLDDVEKLSNA